MKKILIRYRFAIILLIVATLLTACAQPQNVDNCVDHSQAVGFFYGLLHGFIGVVTFVISLFTDNVAMYAVNNNGGWYDFGFLLGIGAFSKGATTKRSSH